MTLEERIERLREDIRRIAKYAGGFRLEVQVLDSSLIAILMKTLSLEELGLVEFRTIDELPDWDVMPQQIAEIVPTPKREVTVPVKRVPPPVAKEKPKAKKRSADGLDDAISKKLKWLHAVAGRHS